MKNCPKCNEELVLIKTLDGEYYICTKCNHIIVIK